MNKIFDTVKTFSDKIREEATFFLFWLKETFNQVKFINWYIYFKYSSQFYSLEQKINQYTV